ncbi:MAG: glycerol kinase GlpK [Elusimicrobia bacterium]|nr:glycerol kinase GlpK [Elusimicrobiota bacterium]
MKDCVLALDLGTTGNRAVVFDRDLKVVAQSYREFPQIFPEPGWVEHDPERIWSTALACLVDALKAAGRGRVAAIGITNQRETTVLWNRRNSKPLYNAIVWQDRRTAEACLAMRGRGSEAMVRRRTGLFLDPYFSATKIRWILDHSPDVEPVLRSGDAVFGTVDSWALWKLTGGQVHATDPSNASRTLLCSLGTASWDDDLCALFGVPRALLPAILPTVGAFGTTAADLVGSEIPILAVAGDQQASLFGQSGFTPDVAKNTYGTGLFVMVNTGVAIPVSDRLLSTIAWTVSGQTEYALEGSVFVGGAAVQWLRDGLGLVKGAAEIEALARSVPDSGGVTFVPALAGLGAPHWDPEARGAVFGLTRGTQKGHLARAALEAMAFQTLDVVREMERATGRPMRRLQVDGGACANDLLLQVQADLLGIPVERPAVRETTAVGVAGLAGLAAGLWPDRQAFASTRKIDKVFEPALAASERERAAQRWRWALERTLTRNGRA